MVGCKISVKRGKEKQMLEIHINSSLEIEKDVFGFKETLKEGKGINYHLTDIFCFSNLFLAFFHVFSMSIDHPLSMSLSTTLNLKNLSAPRNIFIPNAFMVSV